MKAAVLLNASAGALAAAERLAAEARVADAFLARGMEARVAVVDRRRFSDAVRKAAASEADVVVVGGGDGSLSTAATELVDSGKPLGILPLGSLNHFARDLGIPLDLDGAIAAIAADQVRDVDVGEANGRVFLNNASIGLYPAAVAGREELRQRRGHGKWMAMLYACAAVFRRYPVVSLTLRSPDGSARRLTTPFVFVGNNEYDVRLFALGTRPALDRGELSVYLTRNTGRLGLLRLAARALLGRLDQDRDFHFLRLDQLQIETRRRTLRLAIDGEVVRLSPPLRFRVRARALRVLAPPPARPLDGDVAGGEARDSGALAAAGG